MLAPLCVLGLLCLPSGAPASGSVSAFPIPGSHVASPQTQIAFRGVPTSQLGSITVTGSRSGAHSVTVKADSDGNGGSAIPSSPFTPGETVTVNTSLNVIGSHNGTFSFTIANPAGYPGLAHWPMASRNRGDVWTFRSRRDLEPAAVSLHQTGSTAPGDIFLGSQYGPVQDGPELLDPSGNLIWFKRMPGNDSVSDFRVQTLNGQPVLTWWQGVVSAGMGMGEDVISNTAYQVTHYVQAANGLQADLHEFQLTSANTALIVAVYPVYWNATSVGGSSRQIVFDGVVQEIDIPTGLVLFQWDSLDHVPLGDSNQGKPLAGSFYDYIHLNSVEPDRDGTFIISARNTDAAYKVDPATGNVIWVLGGKHSSFKMLGGASFGSQHDIRIRSAHDWWVTMFDDGGGPPRVHCSRGLKLFLDHSKMTAQLEVQHGLPGVPCTNFEGNYQQLPGGDDLVGWGQQPYFTEYNSKGQTVLSGHFIDFTPSYRVYRIPWTGAPKTRPAVAVSAAGSRITVYVSWNGATNVASWRVLGGSSSGSLHTLTTASKRGFETAIATSAESYVAVQALDSGGHVLSQSSTVRG